MSRRPGRQEVGTAKIAVSVSAPQIALGALHPNGLSPNVSIPAAINNLPKGGASGCGFGPLVSIVRPAGT